MSLHCVRRALTAITLTVVTVVIITFAAAPARAGELRSELSARMSPAGPAAWLDGALSLLGGFWTQVSAALVGDNGAGIDPNGGTDLGGGMSGDNGAGIDPNGGESLGGGMAGDNGAGIDPNG